jgi:hypothetical protein
VIELFYDLSERLRSFLVPVVLAGVYLFCFFSVLVLSILHDRRTANLRTTYRLNQFLQWLTKEGRHARAKGNVHGDKKAEVA